MEEQMYSPVRPFIHAATNTMRRMIVLSGFSKLYKYRSLASDQSMDFTRDIIVNNRLYWPSAASLNDTFECRPDVVFEPTEQQVQAGYAELLSSDRWAHIPEDERGAHVWAHMEEYESEMRASTGPFVQELRKSVSILSFSANFSELLIWAHYADAHRGVCLEFTPNESSILSGAMPVIYSDVRPKFNLALPLNPLTMIMDFYLSKQLKWEYEKEYRVFDQQSVGLKSFEEGELTGVILGAEISADHKEAVTSWVASAARPPKLYQAKLSSTTFGIEVEEL